MAGSPRIYFNLQNTTKTDFNMTHRSHRLAQEFAVLDPAHGVTPVTLAPNIYEELDRRFDGFRDHLLVSTHAFDSPWPNWEMHPAGDEIVLLLLGDAELVLEMPDGEQTVHLWQPGDYAIVPRGTWHTARPNLPSRMLFVTPGEGTQNRDAG